MNYVEITALPRTHVLKELAKYATDDKERERLELMASTSPEGKALYQVNANTACPRLSITCSQLIPI